MDQVHTIILPNMQKTKNKTQIDGLRKKDQNKETSEKKKKKKPLLSFSNQQNNKKEKVEKSPRIYDHVSMGTLAENQVCNPKPWEI